MSDYKAVSCGFYDTIESLIVSKEKVDLVFADENNKEKSTNDLLVDLFTKEKAEFVKTYSGEVIRLDKIIKVNDMENIGSNCII